MQLGVLSELRDLVDRQALALFLHAQVHQQALTHRGAQAVHGQDPAVGILGPERLRRHFTGRIGSAQSGRKADVQHVAPRVQLLLHRVEEGLRVDRGGLRRHARAQFLVKGVAVHRARLVEVGLLAQRHAQRQHPQLIFPDELLRQVAGRVGHDAILVCHSFFPLILDVHALMITEECGARKAQNVSFALLFSHAIVES